MRVVKRVIYLFLIVFIAIIGIYNVHKIYGQPDSSYYLQVKSPTTISTNTYQQREDDSVTKPVSDYTIKKCQVITHNDGAKMTFCIADFKGSTGGFYDQSKELMVVGSFDQYATIHEIVHATTLHYLNAGNTDMKDHATQEKMAYNAENLLMQITAFKEDYQESLSIKTPVKTVKKVTLTVTSNSKELAKK